MPKRGKKYKEAAKLVDKTNLYEIDEAMELLTKTHTAKFDETVEVHTRLGVDGRHADQQVRGAIVLPHGTGKEKKVLVFAKGPKATEAEEAGADFVGAEEMAQKIQSENWFDFDVVVATQLPWTWQKPSRKSKPVKLNTGLTKAISSIRLSERFHSVRKRSAKTSGRSWKLSLKQNRQLQRASTLRA